MKFPINFFNSGVSPKEIVIHFLPFEYNETYSMDDLLIFGWQGYQSKRKKRKTLL